MRRFVKIKEGDKLYILKTPLKKCSGYTIELRSVEYLRGNQWIKYLSDKWGMVLTVNISEIHDIL